MSDVDCLTWDELRERFHQLEWMMTLPINAYRVDALRAERDAAHARIVELSALDKLTDPNLCAIAPPQALATMLAESWIAEADMPAKAPSTAARQAFRAWLADVDAELFDYVGIVTGDLTDRRGRLYHDLYDADETPADVAAMIADELSDGEY